MLPPLIVMGLGVGVTIPAIIMLSMAGTVPCDTGLVSGLTNTAQQAGAALGLAVLAAVAAARTSARTAGGEGPLAALRSGYGLAFLVAAGFVLGAAAIAGLVLRHPPSTSDAPAPTRPTEAHAAHS
jgi:hypothetical protein